jgi:hypothetical protein
MRRPCSARLSVHLHAIPVLDIRSPDLPVINITALFFSGATMPNKGERRISASLSSVIEKENDEEVDSSTVFPGNRAHLPCSERFPQSRNSMTGNARSRNWFRLHAKSRMWSNELHFEHHQALLRRSLRVHFRFNRLKKKSEFAMFFIFNFQPAFQTKSHQFNPDFPSILESTDCLNMPTRQSSVINNYLDHETFSKILHLYNN